MAEVKVTTDATLKVSAVEFKMIVEALTGKVRRGSAQELSARGLAAALCDQRLRCYRDQSASWSEQARRARESMDGWTLLSEARPSEVRLVVDCLMDNDMTERLTWEAGVFRDVGGRVPAGVVAWRRVDHVK